MILNMNHFKFYFALFVCFAIIFIVYMIIQKISDKHREDAGEEQIKQSKNPLIKNYKFKRTKFQIIFPNAVLIIAGICLILFVKTWMKYQSYGAFYDDSWKQPDVESHFYFDSSDSEELYKLYKSNPENFNLSAYNVAIVRFGCPECEEDKNALDELKANGIVDYIIYSRSEIGKIFVDNFNVHYVPCVILDGTYMTYPEYVYYVQYEGYNIPIDEYEQDGNDIQSMTDIMQQQMQTSEESTEE